MTLILIYLLPILFMLHEFEEMVMLPAWIEKNEKLSKVSRITIKIVFSTKSSIRHCRM